MERELRGGGRGAGAYTCACQGGDQGQILRERRLPLVSGNEGALLIHCPDSREVKELATQQCFPNKSDNQAQITLY